jgi:hypothetical protein
MDYYCYRSLAFYCDSNVVFHRFLSKDTHTDQIWSAHPPGKLTVYEDGTWRVPPSVNMADLTPNFINMGKVYRIDYDVTYMDR